MACNLYVGARCAACFAPQWLLERFSACAPRLSSVSRESHAQAIQRAHRSATRLAPCALPSRFGAVQRPPARRGCSCLLTRRGGELTTAVCVRAAARRRAEAARGRCSTERSWRTLYLRAQSFSPTVSYARGEISRSEIGTATRPFGPRGVGAVFLIGAAVRTLAARAKHARGANRGGARREIIKTCEKQQSAARARRSRRRQRRRYARTDTARAAVDAEWSGLCGPGARALTHERRTHVSNARGD